MGGPGSGRKRFQVCSKGHDLTNPANVQIIRRGNGKVTRLCRPCQQRRYREWWARRKAKNG